MASPERILQKAIETLESTPPIIKGGCGRRIAVLGDTHGYDNVTRWFLSEIAPDYDCAIILGDLVDRGEHGVENLELAASALVEEPSRVIILRGNHESIEMNRWYGFLQEALSKRGRRYLGIVAKLFRHLPYMVIVHGILMVHGGIPCRACRNAPEPPLSIVEIEEELRRIKGTPEADTPQSSIAFQLLWNDPSLDLDWFSPNIRGEGTFYYGPEAWKSFLAENGLRMIIRAHETVDGIIVYTASKRLIHPLRYKRTISLDVLSFSVITVFSSLYHGLRAAALGIDVGEKTFTAIEYPGMEA